ncbi:hypothetical protein K438DRAFT_2093040, partial [Mycena galopus ATCC 62051]
KSAPGAKHLDRLDLLLRLSRASAIHDPPPRNRAHLLYPERYTPAPVPADFVLRHYPHAPGDLDARVRVHYPSPALSPLSGVPRLGPRKLNPHQQRKTYLDWSNSRRPRSRASAIHDRPFRHRAHFLHPLPQRRYSRPGPCGLRCVCECASSLSWSARGPRAWVAADIETGDAMRL